MRNIAKKIVFASFFGILAGCATIMGNESHIMPISSNPSDAVISITDEKGMEIFKGATPTTVTLQKSDGSYFGKKTYTVKISKSGYETQFIPVTSSPSGYYVAGNILFGGLIGWLIVDPLNGKMYNLSPEAINSTKPQLYDDHGRKVAPAKTTHNNTATNGGISIMLIEDVPADLRGKMQLIN
jgi:hypothetical protein